MTGDRLATETLREHVAAVIARRVSPDRTRAATWLERLTVAPLSWTTLVRLTPHWRSPGAPRRRS